ncbi:ribosomal RNA processing protein 1 homolog [Anopheles marshallii]|uniref:ribosomal RNA processing protein 1 homolog n=1 Tax=Anopheles marshallii TaxID=1521116 RepID=UPI00237C2390|nr:ribosomal RNA processing protein 1 homolog [Anopheles marshallii]
MVVKEDGIVTDRTTSKHKMNDTSSADKSTIIAQEIKFARALAGNNPTLRRRVLKNLKTWLSTRSQSTFVFSDVDFLRLWKGLFYCMWMSDKPLVQEELAESLGSLVRCFDHDVPVAMQFFKAFFTTMGNEWFGIDRWRMDKFMMLVRRLTRQALFTLHENGWQKEHVELFKETIDTTVLNRDVVSYGLMHHFNDLFLNELAKVTDGNISKETVKQIMEVFVKALLRTDDGTVSGSIRKNIFHALMQQSDLGQDFEEKFEIWKSRNFVGGNIDHVEFVTEEDEDGEEEEEENGEGQENEQREEATETQPEEEEEVEELEETNDDGGEGTEKVFDPRAGRVNVDIPQIEFDPQDFIEMFETYRYKSFVNSNGKKRAIQLVKQFTKFAAGVYPIGVKRMPSINPKDFAVNIDEKVEELETFRSELLGDQRKSVTNFKKERRMKIKSERRQKEALIQAKRAKKGENNETVDGNVANESNADTDLPNATEKTTGRTKRKRIRERKMAPTTLRKQAKVDLLERKKAEKLKLLKERLKKKTKSAQFADSDDVPQLVPIVKETASSPVTVKEKKAKPVPASAGNEDKTSKKSKEKAATVNKKLPDSNKPTPNNSTPPFQTKDEWSEPLKEGEEEYFIPSRKTKLSAKVEKTATPVTNKTNLKRTSGGANGVGAVDNDEPITPARKRVKIALSKNVAQDLVEHIKQVKSSPQLPFDSSKKPSKSLLKPNLIPSPINPFYKKKIGLQ